MDKIGIDYLTLAKLYLPWLNNDADLISQEQAHITSPTKTKRAISEAYALAEKLGIQLCGKIVDESVHCGGIWEDTLKEGMCYDPWNMITVKVDGNINVCPNIDYEGLSLEDAPIEMIWNSDLFRMIRRHKKKGIIDEFCERCMECNEFSSWIKCT